MCDPYKQVSHRRLPPYPGNTIKYKITLNEREFPLSGPDVGIGSMGVAVGGMSDDFMRCYLTTHREVLEEYVMTFIDIDTLAHWMEKKLKLSDDLKQQDLQLSKPRVLQQRYADTSLKKVADKLGSKMRNSADVLPLMHEVMCILSEAVRADGMAMYAVVGGITLHIYSVSVTTQEQLRNRKYMLKAFAPIEFQTIVAAYVAKTHESILVRNLEQDERFPQGIGVEGSMASSVLCLPVMQTTGDLVCVMEFTRGLQQTPFSETELQTATCMLAWVSLATFEVKTNVMLKKQNDLNDFLLEVSKAFFDEVGMMSSLLEKIMQYTKDLVHADRISLFLVDKEKKELYIDIFDEGIQDSRGKAMFKRSAEIRVPLTKGIAGFVARTGQIVNIPEAYKDPRFNRAVDKATGYTTKSILSMPIITHGQVIGVVQMINKISPDGVFTSADEYAFKMFAVYCALSLRYAQLYNEIQLKTAQNKVVMEQLTYHSCSTDSDADELLRKWALVPKQVLEDLDDFNYCGVEEYEHLLPHLYIHMVVNVLGHETFDMKRLCRFVLTVKKNYRPMPYHNWTHGWSAAHSIYCILRRFQARETPVFPFFWMRSMLIATICHDVDHRGRNNSFLQETKQPLSTLYKSSVMEQHHYATTIKILQQDGHNIFSNLSASDYRRNLRYIRHCILATDLVTFFPNAKKLGELIKTDTLDLKDELHQEVIVAMVMTAADLSSNYKHFATQKRTVVDLFEEFYQQGDIEKSLGKTPIPLMDRNNKDNLAKDEVTFLRVICRPCYSSLATIFPEMQPLLDGTDTNIATWEAVFAEKNKPPEEVTETPKSVSSSSSSSSSSQSL